MMSCVLTLVCFATSVVLCCSASLKRDTHEVVNLYDGAKLKDCSEAKNAGYNQTGFYKLWINDAQGPYEIFCNMNNELGAGTGAVVLLRRIAGNEGFKRGWYDYKNGFGNPASGDYWVGLDMIYNLTKKWQRLIINMGDWNGNHAAVTYSHFAVTDQSSYRLSIAGYGGGPVPDQFSYLNDMPFGTQDRPDPFECVNGHHGGWWYNQCTHNLLTGHYYIGGKYVPTGSHCDGMFWTGWPAGQGCEYSLKYVVMELTQ